MPKKLPPQVPACAECGMIVEPNEYHPYAACLMFKACKDGSVVRANLSGVRDTIVDHCASVANRSEGNRQTVARIACHIERVKSAFRVPSKLL